MGRNGAPGGRETRKVWDVWWWWWWWWFLQAKQCSFMFRTLIKNLGISYKHFCWARLDQGYTTRLEHKLLLLRKIHNQFEIHPTLIKSNFQLNRTANLIVFATSSMALHSSIDDNDYSVEPEGGLSAAKPMAEGCRLIGCKSRAFALLRFWRSDTEIDGRAFVDLLDEVYLIGIFRYLTWSK